MKNRPKLQNALKGLLLLAMGVFLYTRLANGTLLYYINQRFAGLTLIAVIGLFIVSISYQFGRHVDEDEQCDEHCHPGHDHEHAHHSHNHDLSWSGAILIALPILLGVLVTPQPLGASAMSNREVGFESRSVMPAAVASSTEKSSTDRNVLDWVYAFHEYGEVAFSGEQVDLVGFVYQDDGMDVGEFAITRYVVSCCAADASYVNLIVRSEEPTELTNDQWVRVQGELQIASVNEGGGIVIAPSTIEIIPVPEQPYLYP